jgi:hypothetical protein
MASRPGAGCRMGACETTPPASTSPGEITQPTLPRHPQIPEGSSSLPIIGRRLPASSSFVLAATRLRALQLDPGLRDGTNRQRRGKATTTVTPARRPNSHRPPGQTTAPLDSKGPHGCGNVGAAPARIATASAEQISGRRPDKFGHGHERGSARLRRPWRAVPDTGRDRRPGLWVPRG